MAGMRIENRTRSTFIFEAYKPNPKEGGKPIHDHDNDIVIGDCNNTPELMAAHGASYSRACPSPDVVISKERAAAMSPLDRKVFDALCRGQPDAKPPIPPAFRISAI